MRHPDAGPASVDHERLRQPDSQRRVVHVPVDAVHRRPERGQLLEHGRGGDVPGVEDQIGSTETLDADLWNLPPAARQVRVGDDRDEHC